MALGASRDLLFLLGKRNAASACGSWGEGVVSGQWAVGSGEKKVGSRQLAVGRKKTTDD